MAEELVLRELLDDGVLLLTLHRPERRNAWTLDMEDVYFDLLQEADADPAVRVIVVTGHGDAFSPGADLGVFDKSKSLADLEFGQPSRPPTTIPLTIGKPLIGAINGAVAGVSLVQCLQMDVRFAAAGAKFTFAFSQRGLVAEYGAAWLLPRIVGTGRALDLLLSSRVVTAEEAYDLGLVNRVVPKEQVVDEAVAYARNLASTCSPRSLAVIKRQVYESWAQDIETARQQVAVDMKESFSSPDFKEGVKSFLQKRAPEFPSRP
jgi:enoyl-CoA hydratase/carnithine racemase